MPFHKFHVLARFSNNLTIDKFLSCKAIAAHSNYPAKIFDYVTAPSVEVHFISTQLSWPEFSTDFRIPCNVISTRDAGIRFDRKQVRVVSPCLPSLPSRIGRGNCANYALSQQRAFVSSGMTRGGDNNPGQRENLILETCLHRVGGELELVRRQITPEGSAALSLRTIIIVTTALYFATIILKKSRRKVSWRVSLFCCKTRHVN